MGFSKLPPLLYYTENYSIIFSDIKNTSSIYSISIETTNLDGMTFQCYSKSESTNTTVDILFIKEHNEGKNGLYFSKIFRVQSILRHQFSKLTISVYLYANSGGGGGGRPMGIIKCGVLITLELIINKKILNN